MFDYYMHFAQLVTEERLRDADRQRGQARPSDGHARMVRLVKDRAAAREQGRR